MVRESPYPYPHAHLFVDAVTRAPLQKNAFHRWMQQAIKQFTGYTMAWCGLCCAQAEQLGQA